MSTQNAAILPGPAKNLIPALTEAQSRKELQAIDQAKRRNLEQNSRAHNTSRTYSAAWRKFQEWCQRHGFQPLPATPDDVARYLNWLEIKGQALATIRTARTAISQIHAEAGVPESSNPCRNASITSTIRNMSRHAKPQRQTKGLLPEDLAAIEATAHNAKPRGRSGHPETPETARRRGDLDIAICFTMRDAGLRRSEAADLTWEQIQRQYDGTGTVTLYRTKTNRTGRPETVVVTAACMTALGRITPTEPSPGQRVFKLSAGQIAVRIAAAAEHAGLGPGYGGHSGRVGLARTMIRAQAPATVTMEQGRWKKQETLNRYGQGEALREALKYLA